MSVESQRGSGAAGQRGSGAAGQRGSGAAGQRGSGAAGQRGGGNLRNRDSQIVNRTIFEGDNLEVLRGFNSKSVDLVYLDPPFNSNHYYAAPVGSEAAGAAFKDTWTWDDVKAEEHGLLADEHPGLYKVIEATGYSHGRSMMSYLIMMASRLRELNRVLKDSGSIYLHCDPTASHYLRLVMDAVFGKDNFRNEIVWNRSGGKSDSKRWGRVSDRILYYVKGPKHIWNQQYQPLNPSYVEKAYRYDDKDGRGPYRKLPLHAPSVSNGPSGEPWRQYNPSDHNRHWATPSKGVMHNYIVANRLIPGWETNYPTISDKLDALDRYGLMVHSDNYLPEIKSYLAASNGVAVTDIIADVPMASGRERTGYPTQKPIKLLERIIKASSNENDVVLDPFCGCATTCIAAEKLNRQWIGIDLSALSVKLVEQRARKELGLIGGVQSILRTDIPKRTDLGILSAPKRHKHTLFGNQEGRCNGCGIVFPFQNFTIDHVIPQSQGGTDHFDNLQLLCNSCNSTKGDRTMAYLLEQLKIRRIIE